MLNLRKSFLPFMIPALILIILIQFLPLIYGFVLSLQNIILNKPHISTKFIGFTNYLKVIKDPAFQYSLKITLLIGLVSVAIQLVMGLGLALTLNTETKDDRQLPGSGIIRALLFMPYMVMPVIVGLIWLIMFDRRYGLFNFFYGFFAEPKTWFADPKVAIWAIIIMDTWQCTPMMMLILSAGLKAIPHTPYEAASIDGASAWQRFVYITLPLLKPILLVSLVIRTMDVLRIFDSIFVTTRGGPGRVTEVMSVYGYKTAFLSYRISEAAAAGWIMTLVILLVSVMYFKVFSSDEISS